MHYTQHEFLDLNTYLLSFSEKSDDKIYIYDLELEDCGGMDLMTSPNSSIMPLANYSMQGKIIHEYFNGNHML